MNAAWPLTRRMLASSRGITIGLSLLVIFYGAAQVVGYRATYPTVADRLGLAASLGDSPALRLFYGEPRNLLTTPGYAAWRVGGTLALLVAVFGIVLSVRDLRGEEDSGRMEVVLSGLTTRRGTLTCGWLAATLGVGTVCLCLAVTLAATRLPLAGSAFLGLVLGLCGLCFVAIGSVVSQVMPTRRSAYAVAMAIFGLLFVLRVAADTRSGLGWLRWTTPLGWVEEARAFTGARPAALIPSIVLIVILGAVAAALVTRRDVGTGIFQASDSAAPRLRLMTSPSAQTVRVESLTLTSWAIGVGAMAFVIGSLATSISEATIPESLRPELKRLGLTSLVTPTGYLALVILFFALIISLGMAQQVGAARREEADQRLETLLALPVSRTRWLAGRIVIAAVLALLLGLETGIMSWAGARVSGGDVPLGGLAKAGVNCVPTAFLFLSLSVLAFGFTPRLSSYAGYGLVATGFVWEVVGDVVSAPSWALDLSPFRHLGLVPIHPFPFLAAAIMTAIGVAAAAAGAAGFRRRDQEGA
jgi:ABC-2 type transport system permease protein